jgi:hypothetical protein
VKELEYNETVHLLFIGFKKTYDSVKSILIEFGVPIKLIRLIKMCLNETHTKVRIGKHLSDSFPIQNGCRLPATGYRYYPTAGFCEKDYERRVLIFWNAPLFQTHLRSPLYLAPLIPP